MYSLFGNARNAMQSIPPAATHQQVRLDAASKSRLAQVIAREKALSRLLMVYITSGLLFMLLPGTFLGVWNLILISKREAAESIAPAWIQAHGHAQLFGWVGSFILGIGFYSIPKLRKLKPFALWEGWLCWALWSSGVLLRWAINVHPWHWRALLPVSAALELVAFLVFFQAVLAHRSAGSPGKPWEAWIFMVIGATLGLLLTLGLNLGASIFLARRGSGPAFPPGFDQRFLVVSTWGFLVPMVWGFSARWLPIFLGLRTLRGRRLLFALSLNSAGVALALFGQMMAGAIVLLAGSIFAVLALRIFEPSERQQKVAGVHPSFPVFARIAYGWLVASAMLAVWAVFEGGAAGISGASRHALTVGFIATMVFSIGQRVLPSFCGGRLLFSPTLMLACLALLVTGCTLRVVFEVLAYQNYAAWAWDILPVSALIELTAVTVFAVNMAWTFAKPPVVALGPLTQYSE
jgi:hypothetical protein